LIVRQIAKDRFSRSVAARSVAELPPGEVLIRVLYSSLNYKDALSASGHKGVTKRYPHTPGIDAAGVVEESLSGSFHPGDTVLVTGYDLGMNTPGGFGQYIRVPSDWVVRLPQNLSLRESMCYGTAGFTAALSILRLTEHDITPEQGEILVTGATGGVGSIAVSILSRAGFDVVAVSGKPDQKQFLLGLGAKEVLDRETAEDLSGKPLLKPRWAGAVDVVGGDILATAIKSTRYGGAITCCGNVASPELHTTVFPFILRGVRLLGIDSVHCPMHVRIKIWEKLSHEWRLEGLEGMVREVTLDELDGQIETILQGRQKGRIIVNLHR
jgi:acrylyl-CoA reductase (NADPH)